MKNKVKIGTCGFRTSKDDYFQLLSTVEIQHTFYQPPQIATLERWRKESPPEFEFTLKAWQLITHAAKSPTYKRLKKKLSEIEQQEAGYFKPTAIVKEAWDATLACAKALKAKTILFQCPASFKPTRENIANLENFFSSINREKFNFCWEPRGDWNEKIVKDICKNLDLWHTVDPFLKKTETPEKCYFRLHGRNGWRYKYEESELEELATLLPKNRISYIFFNNIEMTEDALKFQEIVDEYSSR
ncbi:MAG: DUF72 domain-containing protein [Acidobacteria bacterium]|jgi:uncharacterized protein YecE (DUF72 family)|nr:DUF72 domain-containing protein [Acidobacteriota bacterium]